ncbi:MAG: hypothetical protein M1840_008697 [Geoglossum simile]|nr:MAG: hypothetical protein M1840_008697 [Geoglossum simile]
MTNRIGSGERAALLEAFAAAAELLPPTLRKQFVLVGGASMLLLGGTRWTSDIDIVVTAEALNAFEEAAAHDPHFSKDVVHSWSYTSTTPGIDSVCVGIEFLAMGGEFAPVIRAARPVLGGFRAGLAELVLMKGRAVDSRGEPKDREDLRFILEKMEGSEESFGGVEMDNEDLETLADSVKSLGGRYSDLLQSLLRRA